MEGARRRARTEGVTVTDRRILVVAHTGRPESLSAAVDVVRLLRAAGVRPVVDDESLDDLNEATGVGELLVLGRDVEVGELELVIVLGGDGTILRAAELARGGSAPLLGINLGHVGFLAESERDDLASAVGRALERDYLVEERMTLAVRVKLGTEVIYETWALNEATVEKASRAHARSRHRGGWSAPVELWLRRRRDVDANGFNRIRVLGRRAHRVAQPRCSAAGTAQRPRPVRSPARGGAQQLSRRRGA